MLKHLKNYQISGTLWANLLQAYLKRKESVQLNRKKNPKKVNEVFEVQKEDCNVIITLKNGKEYEGPKILVSEDIPTRDEPTVEKNVRNEKESKKYEEVFVSKDEGSVSNHFPFLSF